MVNTYEAIDLLLKKKGISGAKMSSDLGMSRSFLTELRKGRAKSITGMTAQRIAEYFGVSIDYVLGTDSQVEIDILEYEIEYFEKELLTATEDKKDELEKTIAGLKHSIAELRLLEFRDILRNNHGESVNETESAMLEVFRQIPSNLQQAFLAMMNAWVKEFLSYQNLPTTDHSEKQSEGSPPPYEE